MECWVWKTGDAEWHRVTRFRPIIDSFKSNFPCTLMTTIFVRNLSCLFFSFLGLSFIPTLWDSALLATLSFGKKDWTMSTDITRPTGQRFSSKINVMQKIPKQFEINLSHQNLDGSVYNHNGHAKKLPLKILFISIISNAKCNNRLLCPAHLVY